jgi:hypothetical protein
MSTQQLQEVKKIHWTVWLNSQPANKIQAVKRRILRECKVTRSTLVFWIYGYTCLPDKAQKKICKLADNPDLDFKPRPSKGAKNYKKMRKSSTIVDKVVN